MTVRLQDGFALTLRGARNAIRETYRIKNNKIEVAPSQINSPGSPSISLFRVTGSNLGPERQSRGPESEAISEKPGHEQLFTPESRPVGLRGDARCPRFLRVIVLLSLAFCAYLPRYRDVYYMVRSGLLSLSGLDWPLQLSRRDLLRCFEDSYHRISIDTSCPSKWEAELYGIKMILGGVFLGQSSLGAHINPKLGYDVYRNTMRHYHHVLISISVFLRPSL